MDKTLIAKMAENMKKMKRAQIEADMQEWMIAKGMKLFKNYAKHELVWKGINAAKGAVNVDQKKLAKLIIFLTEMGIK